MWEGYKLMPVITKYGIRFYWHDSKYQTVLSERNIDFHEALSVFDDPFHLTVVDDRFEYNEIRLVTVGMSSKNRVITVVWYEINDFEAGLITAFKASVTKIKEYKNAKK